MYIHKKILDRQILLPDMDYPVKKLATLPCILIIGTPKFHHKVLDPVGNQASYFLIMFLR